MKKVRFESPDKAYPRRMDDFECHSPRPFIEKQETYQPNTYCFSKPLIYSPDPVHRFENSNSSPYPLMRKTSVAETGSRFLPSNDLNLSILDGGLDEPRNPIFCNKQLLLSKEFTTFNHSGNESRAVSITPPNVLSSIENVNFKRPAPKNDSNNFFIRRSELDKFHVENATPLQDQLNRLSLSKENVSLAKKTEMIRLASDHTPVLQDPHLKISNDNHNHDDCPCPHCRRISKNSIVGECIQNCHDNQCSNIYDMPQKMQQSSYRPPHCASCKCSNCSQRNYAKNQCICYSKVQPSPQPYNLVDKKAWILKKYQENESNCMEIDKQQNIVKEKREPTVADLFKIIKLQNEQLKLLQEKVDNFILSNNHNNNPPVQNFVTEQVAIDSEQHKISIGVMTSFEMVRTSTIINKEIVKQTTDNAQIHCNKSQISIKEVVSKTQPVNQNFLDGIAPVGRPAAAKDIGTEADINDDKTVNDFSLYNVQVDNATTPQISPEQSLYLDVRDYSDSESGSDDQSNVGWTYYNKVMTHVNGMLQDSDMPSSASALYRNTRQQCVQMHIDKTNVSVTKRVKFGDDPLGIQQPHIYAAPTDVSLKMHQLAAKYLERGALSTPVVPKAQNQIMVPMEMSFATKNYMERHRILQGDPRAPAQYTGEMPRFLDITALKQQPKLL